MEMVITPLLQAYVDLEVAHDSGEVAAVALAPMSGQAYCADVYPSKKSIWAGTVKWLWQSMEKT